jgi:hypothetical protein
MCPNTIVDFGCAAGAGAARPRGDGVVGPLVSTVAVGPAPRAALAPGDAGELPGEPTDGAGTGELAVFDAAGTEPPTFESAVPVATEGPAATVTGPAVESAGAEVPGLSPARPSLTAVP